MKWMGARSRLLLTVCVALLVAYWSITTPPRFHYSTTNADDGDSAAVEVREGRSGDGFLDLTLFVVFHRRLPSKLFGRVNWSQIPSFQGQSSKEERIRHDMAHGAAHDITRIVFVASNPTINKDSPSFAEGRTLREWELSGYDKKFGWQFNEYGVMSSLYRSGLTLRDCNASIHAGCRNDAPPSWVGLVQFDMRVDQPFLDSLRRRMLANSDAVVGARQPRPTRRRRCCIFYSMTVAAVHMYSTPLALFLLHRWNIMAVERGSATTTDEQLLHSGDAITDAFIVPRPLYNHVAQFLVSIMDMLTSDDGKTTVPVQGADGVVERRRPNSLTRSEKLDVLEAALSVALGAEGSMYRRVRIPLRHLREVGS